MYYFQYCREIPLLGHVGRVFKFSIKVILACVVKLWPAVEKCWSTGIESCFLESERWLFIRRLVAGSLFPM